MEYLRYLELAFLMAANFNQDPFKYAKRIGYQPKMPKPMTPEREAKINAKIDKNMHDFNINGTIIRAKNKKTAKMIYERRLKG